MTSERRVQMWDPSRSQQRPWSGEGRQAKEGLQIPIISCNASKKGALKQQTRQYLGPQMNQQGEDLIDYKSEDTCTSPLVRNRNYSV